MKFLKQSVVILLLLLPLPSFAGGQLGKVGDYWHSLEYSKKEGLIAAIYAKELCSCLFVQDVYKRFKSVTSENERMNQAISVCRKRTNIPLLSILALRTYISVYKLRDRKIEGNEYAPYKLVVDRRTGGWFRVPNSDEVAYDYGPIDVQDRFESVVDQNPRYGCRMRPVYMAQKGAIDTPEDWPGQKHADLVYSELPQEVIDYERGKSIP